MAATILKPMDDLPHTPASDVKKLGWRGVMQVVARNGRMVVTNHNKPEAVILPVEEYNRLLALLREAGEKDRSNHNRPRAIAVDQIADKWRFDRALRPGKRKRQGSCRPADS